MVKVSELLERQTTFPGGKGPLLTGNYACAGCGLSVAYRTAISALDNPVVVIPACCASVIQSLHPDVTYNVPTLNIAFASHAAAASGISRAKKALGEKVTTVVWSGDGGTFDIGMATLSGAAERNEDVIHFCYDNSQYTNTGNQRSGATPRGAKTTTTPSGKLDRQKSIGRIMMAHNIPYVATATIGYLRDLYDKTKKASEMQGFRFFHIHQPCATSWDYDPRYTITLGKLAVQTGFFPMYEIIDGTLTFDKRFAKYAEKENRKPLEEYLKYQGRFKRATPEMIKILEEDIDAEWEALKKLQ
ncbi:MAG: thiamine pyrophosphate-dependent enzyme [Candidatus Hodarchaeales archaeon]|jgi:pyruvate ferredoxin oxidoreductase beta subunit